MRLDRHPLDLARDIQLVPIWLLIWLTALPGKLRDQIDKRRARYWISLWFNHFCAKLVGM
jgi:hypothetical protein